MWMLMVRAQGFIGREVQAIADSFERDFLPAISRSPGYLGAVTGVNLARGAGFSLSFWETQEAMDEVERNYAQARDELEEAWKADDPYITERMKVVFATEVLSDVDSGDPYIRIVHHSGLDAQALDRLAHEYSDSVGSDFDMARGADGGVVAVDVRAGTLAVLSFWETERDLRSSVKGSDAKSVPGAPAAYHDNFALTTTSALDRLVEIEEVSIPG